jgi:hypothetical protein
MPYLQPTPASDIGDLADQPIEDPVTLRHGYAAVCSQALLAVPETQQECVLERVRPHVEPTRALGFSAVVAVESQHRAVLSEGRRPSSSFNPATMELMG